MSNRIYKFRAWDTKKKKIVYHFHLHEDFSYTLEYYRGGHQTRFIPMQFTGLKDRNGNEIYEGYIVKNKKQIEIVEFCLDENKDYYAWFKPFGNYLRGTIEASKCEVIGNKFENPELLK